jgi:hypothetical protein
VRRRLAHGYQLIAWQQSAAPRRRGVPELEFAVIRDTLEVTDAHLSKNLTVLSEAQLSQPRICCLRTYRPATTPKNAPRRGAKVTASIAAFSE